ncbi:MAG: glycosyltransferase family 2 protein [Elusimicrobia bacterium]|nr:glycosyltransferase family 2 protein [Elusimicrobiota bacterium]
MILPHVSLAGWWAGVGERVEISLIWYFFLLNGIYVVLSLIAFRDVYSHLLRSIYGGYEQIARSPLTPAISVLVPAYNEEVGIALTVTNLLHLDYMRYEVIVVDDGSTDRTLDELKKAFQLEPDDDRAGEESLRHAPLRGVYRSRRHHNLLVLAKENGGKADALNAALDYAQYPYFSTIDADVVLEPDALQRVIQPIVESDRRVVAVGGIIRVANGCRVEHGRVVDIEMPRRTLVLLQIVEYFRAFLCGRTGFSRLNCLMIISGAFGVFDRDLAIEAGGYSVDTVGEDMDLVTRLHALMRERGERDYAVRFVPDPVCWTEVPSNLRVLARQRRRWQRGLLEVLSARSEMLFNPRYGALGLFAYPFFWLFEGWGVVLELLGYAVFAALWMRGAVQSDYVIAFLFVAFLCGTTLSLCGILLGEMTPRSYPKMRHWLTMMFFAVVENFGYRQLTSLLRLLGIFDFLRGRRGWGRMERQGLHHREAAA